MEDRHGDGERLLGLGLVVVVALLPFFRNVFVLFLMFLAPLCLSRRKRRGGKGTKPWRTFPNPPPSIGIRCLKTRTDCSKTCGMDMNAKRKKSGKYEKSRRKVIKSPKRSEIIFEIEFCGKRSALKKKIKKKMGHPQNILGGSGQI